MATAKEEMEALAGGQSTKLVIPPFPAPKFSPRFINAFPEDVKLQMEHHAQVEEWRKKTNQAVLGTTG